jgi:hypothetical protein
VVLSAIWTVKYRDTETRAKLLKLLLPLVDDRLGDDDESSGASVSDHGCDELDCFTETHLIAKETTLGAFCCELATQEPFDPLALVRNYETTFESSHEF